MDFTKQIADNRRALIADIIRRVEQSLEPFAFALDWFLADLFRSRLPMDWRDRWHAFVAEQANHGFFVEPQSVRELEAWIEAWARYCGLLPIVNGARSVADKDGNRTVTNVAKEKHQTQINQLAHQPDDDGSPFVSAGFKSRPRPKTPDSRPPQAPTPRPRPTMNAEGLEVAGPGPTTTDSYRTKVQKALETLDPKVAQWWRANSVQGQVRSRAAAFWQFGHYSQLEKEGQPAIVVDQNFTAGQTAQAIITEVSSGWFADSIGAFYKKYRLAKSLSSEEFRQWQRQSVGEAARLASVLAELYVNSIAALTPAGDLAVTLGDLADNGPRWDQLLSVLPLLSHLPIGAIIVKAGKRQVRIPRKIARKFEKLTDKERKSILVSAAAAKNDDAAAATLKREVVRHVGDRQIHHAISETVYKALEKHKNLRGKYQLRDKRFESLAIDYEAHHGWEEWHRNLDAEVAAWIEEHPKATVDTFESWLRWRYSQPDIKARFPSGF